MKNNFNEEQLSINKIGKNLGYSKQYISQTLKRCEDKINRSFNTTADSIGSLYLNTRTYNALKNVGITTIDELVKLTDYDLSQIKSLGRTSVKHLNERLKQFGYTRVKSSVSDDIKYILKKHNISIEQLLEEIRNVQVIYE